MNSPTAKHINPKRKRGNGRDSQPRLAYASGYNAHIGASMDLNKKQKKQIEVARKKLSTLKQQLAGARRQPDDPADIPRLEAEIARLEAEIRSIQDG
jgi:hypothetical protein